VTTTGTNRQEGIGGTVNRRDAEEAGYIVDDSVWPWVAYKGSRFDPDAWYIIDTPAYTANDGPA
jgi:hypothetical protein